MLNTSRWMPVASTSLIHCPTPGAVGAANAATCTAALGSQLQMGVPLPGYPTGGLGLIMTLSQKPCAISGNCCVNGVCANWAGAHLRCRLLPAVISSLPSLLRVRTPQGAAGRSGLLCCS